MQGKSTLAMNRARTRVRTGARNWARRWEAPTWALIAIIYGGWVSITWFWHDVPLWVAVPCAAWLCAWHMSFQHEAIHFHPTRVEWINTALAYPPLVLWLPFPLYRLSHRQHHQDHLLTDPLEDPESTYMTPSAWTACGTLHRACHSACNTFLGRIVFGPAQAVAVFWARQLCLAGTRQAPTVIWLSHAAAVTLLLAWIVGVCRIDPLAYVLGVAYPGTMLAMIRSLAEHRAAARPEDRTAVVEHAPVLGLLFLFNNLHVLHHARPEIPWYDLPGVWRVSRQQMLAGRHGPVYRGYREVALRYLLRPHHPGPHPQTLSA
jgi:fatty acid desaturase